MDCQEIVDYGKELKYRGWMFNLFEVLTEIKIQCG